MEQTIHLRKTARLAGLFYLLQVLATGFNLGYVRSALIVAGNATATANNIMANESLFRMAIVSNLFAQLFLLFFGVKIVRLFTGVNKTWSAVFLTSIVMTVTIAVVNSLNTIGALTVLGKADYLAVFGQEQRNAIMMIFLRLNNSGIGLFELFFAPSLFAFGVLIIKSTYIPKILGILLIISTLGFPINTLTKLLIPQLYPVTFTQFAMFCGALGGIPIIFWLLIKGVNVENTASFNDRKNS